MCFPLIVETASTSSVGQSNRGSRRPTPRRTRPSWSARTACYEGDTTDLGKRLVLQLNQHGFDQPIMFNNTTWHAHTISSNFGNPTNAYLSTGYDLDSPGFKQFDADLTESHPMCPNGRAI